MENNNQYDGELKDDITNKTDINDGLNSKDDEEIEPLTTCSKCGEEVEDGEFTEFDDEILCEDCLDEHTFVCAHCSERFWNDSLYYYRGNQICENCDDYHYSRCSDCGTTILNDNSNYLDNDEDSENPYCDDCYNRTEKSCIRSYNFKPEPIFYGENGLFFGLELEIDKGGENNENAQEIINIANLTNEKIYCKHDGSLGNGFEIVTHPMTLDFHQAQMPWKKVMMKAIEMNYRSHNTETCGLHVHVGKRELSEDYEKCEEIIGRILYFIEKFWSQMLIFSRRTEENVNKWANRYGLMKDAKETLKNAKNNYGSRYVCLNLQNYTTIEFRIFRGTLKFETLMAVIQMVNLICITAISLCDEEFQNMSWGEFVGKVDVENSKELYDYLNTRNLL